MRVFAWGMAAIPLQVDHDFYPCSRQIFNLLLLEGHEHAVSNICSDGHLPSARIACESWTPMIQRVPENIYKNAHVKPMVQTCPHF